MSLSNPFAKQETENGSFLPSEYVSAKQGQKANLYTVVLFTVTIVAVLSAFVITNRSWQSVKKEREAVDALYSQELKKIEQLEELEAQRAKLMDKAAVTTALIDAVPRSVLLAELVTRMPENVAVQELELSSKRMKAKKPVASASKTKSLSKSKSSKKKAEEPVVKVQAPRFEQSLSLTGVAASNNDVADYLEDLKRSPLLEDVELRYITQTKLDGIRLRKFQIEAGVRSEADARELASVIEVEPLAVVGVPTEEVE